MWNLIARVVLRNRISILIGIAVLTCFLGYKATQVKLSYEMARMLPTNDENFVKYQNFKKVFGEDGNVFFIGFSDPRLFEISRFNDFYKTCDSIKDLEGVQQILSIANIYTLHKNDSLKKFEVRPVFQSLPKTQAELDSLKHVALNLKFYNNLLFNKETQSYMIGITLTKDKLNDKSRFELVDKVEKIIDRFSKKSNIEIHYSGLPYIRTEITQMIQHELYLFIVISLIIAALVMILFFRSFYVVFTSLIIVAISVIWTLGIIALFDYKISILIGVFPSLLIIIAIENCIYLVNKYHLEYKKHGNKIKSLSRVMSRIGFATLMTNATTATGFATFIFTSNEMLKEFGIISSINVMLEYVISLILTIIIFSYLPEPKHKQLKHLDRKSTNFIVEWIKYILQNHRKTVYALSAIIVVVCAYGVTKMQISGKLVDDIPPSNKIYTDLKFFEKNAGGVMPFEISIDTKEKKGVFKDGGKVIYKIKLLQKCIKNDSSISKNFSRPMSIVEGICFANQMYKDGKPKFYIVPPPMELANLSKYVGGNTGSNKNAFRSFLDSNMQTTRVSIQMADVGTTEMNKILKKIQPVVDSIFPKKDYNVVITGNSVTFSKGTEFLINNLWESIIIGVVLISLLVAIVFSSLRMIVIAMLVNLIPLLVTAAIMGFFNIPVKPSTIIVFSVALGISIDNAILYLTRYRHELKRNKHSVFNSVMNAMDESAVSMIYASIVLVLGFSIYMLSGFGGTKALGFLISVTLFVALFFNIIVLPSLLLSLDKFVAPSSFEDPIIDIDDENDEEKDAQNKEELDII